MAHKVDPGVLAALWERVKVGLVQPVAMFVNIGIRADKGKTKKQTEEEVWMGLIEAAYKQGVTHGYDMACDVHEIPDDDEPAKGGE